MLTGLCYRALAGSASADAAPLTLRRLEHVHAEQTELLKRISALKGELGVLQEKALRAQTESRQAMLDLQLFDESHPDVAALEKRPRRRRKLTAEEAQLIQERAELAELAKQAAEDVAQIAKRAEQASRELLEAEARRQVARLERQRWESQLLEEAAAWVLGLIAAGQEDEARRALAELRRLVRGELMVAVLFVVDELLTGGPEAMLQAIPEMKPIFDQHPDPLPRILSALAQLVVGSVRLDREQMGLPPPAVFSQRAHLRLYALICALGGWSAAEMMPLDEPFRATLSLVYEDRCAADEAGMAIRRPAVDPAALRAKLAVQEVNISLADGEATVERRKAGELAELAAGDNVLRLIAANIMLRRIEHAAVLKLCGIEIPAQPPRRGQAWPALLPALSVAPIPAWPEALAERVNAALACHVLLAARDCAPPGLYEAWLAESYGWPKDDFYWWALACLEDDVALRRNVTGSPDQLFMVPPL